MTFAEAAREWLRYCEQDRACKPSTMQAYRSSVHGRLIPVFGDMLIGDIAPIHIERWRASLPVGPRMKPLRRRWKGHHEYQLARHGAAGCRGRFEPR